MKEDNIWAAAIVKIFGMMFDIVMVGGTVWLIGWNGWSAWWMVLSVLMCSDSWELLKKVSK